MRRLILFLIFLILTVWVSVELVRHPGYLLISYQSWAIQVSLGFALIAVLFFLILFYFLIQSINQIRWWNFKFTLWSKRKRELNFHKKTERGLTELIEEHWKKAEKLLLKNISHRTNTFLVINYLGAAKAAQAQGNLENTEHYLKKAYEIAPENEVVIGIVRAELLIASQRFEAAAAILNELREKVPAHAKVLQLAEKVYVHLGDWNSLLGISHAIQKIRKEESHFPSGEQLEKNIYCVLLEMAKPQESEIEIIWRHIPNRLKKNPKIVYAYVKAIFSHPDKTPEIEKLIRSSLKMGFQGDLVKLYSDLNFASPHQALIVAGSWLKLYGPKPEILYTLAKLCRQAKLWGKAKDYFEQSLSLSPHPSIFLCYGELLESLGEDKKALKIYHDGLASYDNIKCS